MVIPTLTLRDVARKSARAFLPAALFQRAAEKYNRACCARRIQPEDYESFVAMLYGGKMGAGDALVQVHVKGMEHPLLARPGTPDAVEIGHSVIREAYGKYLPDGDVNFIVDAGAYIGDATAWYLSRFPASRVVALEPNPDTFAMLQINCAPYGSRVKALNGALWFQDGELDLVLDPSTPTGISVVEHKSASHNRCEAFSLGTILDQAAEPTIDILKVDIEGAELELFSENPDPWLSRTRSIAIEIHSPAAYAAVHSATRRHGFTRHRYRELYIFIKNAA